MSYESFRNNSLSESQQMIDFNQALYRKKVSGNEIKTVHNVKSILDSHNHANLQKGYFESMNYDSSCHNISENVEEKEELIPNSPKVKQGINLAGISTKQSQSINVKNMIIYKNSHNSKLKNLNKRNKNQINFTPNFGLNEGKKKYHNKKYSNPLDISIKKDCKHNLSSNSSTPGFQKLKSESKKNSSFKTHSNSLLKETNFVNSKNILNSKNQKIEVQNPDTGSSAILQLSPKIKGKSSFVKNNQFYQTCLQKLFEKYQKIDLIKQEKIENEIKGLTFTPKINEINEGNKKGTISPNRNTGNNNLKSKSTYNLIMKLQEAHQSGKQISFERNRQSKLKNTLDLSKKFDNSVQINIKDLNKRNNSYFSISNDQSQNSLGNEQINPIISFSESNNISPTFQTKSEYSNYDNYNIFNSRIKRAFSILFSRLDLNKDGVISYYDFSSLKNSTISQLYEPYFKMKSKKINLSDFILLSEKIYKKLSNEMKNNFIRFCTIINCADMK